MKSFECTKSKPATHCFIVGFHFNQQLSSQHFPTCPLFYLSCLALNSRTSLVHFISSLLVRAFHANTYYIHILIVILKTRTENWTIFSTLKKLTLPLTLSNKFHSRFEFQIQNLNQTMKGLRFMVASFTNWQFNNLAI